MVVNVEIEQLGHLPAVQASTNQQKTLRKSVLASHCGLVDKPAFEVGRCMLAAISDRSNLMAMLLPKSQAR